MNRALLILLFPLLLGAVGAACAGDPSPGPATASPTTDPAYNAAQGAGEPRGSGYWLLWNSCAPDNRAVLAAANGGRAAGWIIMDDLLHEPGVLLGKLPVLRCPEGLNLLQGRDLDGAGHEGDAAYQLASQLLAAQLNLAAGAEHCPAVDDAVRSAQLQLLALGWNGLGPYLDQGAAGQDQDHARSLITALSDYNAGNLCR